MKIAGQYSKDPQGFTYVFPDDAPGTMYIGCAGSVWRRLSIGDQTYACGTLTPAMYSRLRSECVEHGTFTV